jgi:hypothetical protein
MLINVTRSEKELTMILYHADKRSPVSIITEKGEAGLVIPPTESFNTNAISTGLRSEQGTAISTVFTSQVNSQVLSDIQTLAKTGFKPSLLLLPKHLSEEVQNEPDNGIATAYVSFYNFSPMTKMSFAPRGDEENFMHLQIFDHKIMLVHTLETGEMSDDSAFLASAELSDLSLLVLPEIETAEEFENARKLIARTDASSLVITNGQSKYSIALLNDPSVQKMSTYLTSRSGALFCNISENSLKIDTLFNIRKRKEVIIRSFLQ